MMCVPVSRYSKVMNSSGCQSVCILSRAFSSENSFDAEAEISSRAGSLASRVGVRMEARVVESVVIRRVPQRLVWRQYRRDFCQLRELRDRETQQLLLLVDRLATRFGILDRVVEVGESGSVLGNSADVPQLLKGVRLRDEALALGDEAITSQSKLVLDPVALRLEPLVTLLHLGLHLARPRPRLAHQPQLLLIQVICLLHEEAERLAALVELAVQLLQQARTLSHKLLEFDHLFFCGRVLAQPQVDLLVARAHVGILLEEAIANGHTDATSHVDGA
eukprot:scaffold75957_cov28-Tisochrysis_lutea.AAC.2